MSWMILILRSAALSSCVACTGWTLLLELSIWSLQFVKLGSFQTTRLLHPGKAVKSSCQPQMAHTFFLEACACWRCRCWPRQG